MLSLLLVVIVISVGVSADVVDVDVIVIDDAAIADVVDAVLCALRVFMLIVVMML